MDNGWIKVSEDEYCYPELKNFRGLPCMYTFEEALAIQNGWDISNLKTKA
jgi:hypothetical protein